MILGPRSTSLVTTGAVQSAVWTPAELPSPLVFGDVALATIDAGAVAAVGGLEQSTPALRPAYLASDSAFAGQPSAVLTGTQWMAGTAPAGAAPTGWTLWAVARWDTHASVRTLLDTAAPSGVPFGILAMTATNALRYGSSGYATGPVLDASAHLVAYTLRNGPAPNFDLWIDGVLVSSASSPVSDPWASNALALGRDHTPFGWMMRGATSAFGLAGAPLSSDDQSSLHGWSSARFGTP